MRPKHITDYLYENAKKYPNKLALVCDDKSLTWAELCNEVETRSNYLRDQFSGPNQKIISLLMPNSWQFVVAYLAIIDSGHISVPIDVIYKPLEIEAIVKQISPDLLIYDNNNAERIANKDKSLAFDDLKKVSVNTEKLRLSPGDQIASLVFTSGTTGKPKIAPYTHSNHLWNIKACSEVWGWNENDTMLLSLRLSHWYGICMGISGALYHSNTIYLKDSFDALETLNMLSSGKVSLFSHTPYAFSKMLDVDGEYDLSEVHLLISGSAALPPAIWEKFKEKFNIEIIETYGSSETGRIAANSYQNRRPGSPGYLFSDVSAKLIDGSELAVKSPGLFPGYFNNQAATDANLTNDGYWRTGDLAEIVDRRVVLKGRLQERLAKFGYSISPRDIEWALGQNKKIKECAVIGEQAPGEDDKLIYFIVGHITESELINYTKSDLPSIWRPDKIIFLEELPRTSNGKVALQVLKDLLG